MRLYRNRGDGRRGRERKGGLAGQLGAQHRQTDFDNDGRREAPVMRVAGRPRSASLLRNNGVSCSPTDAGLGSPPHSVAWAD
jgi:hypothetical protein